MAAPGLKVWLEYQDDRHFAIAAQFRSDGKPRFTRIRTINYPESDVACNGFLTRKRGFPGFRKPPEIDGSTKREYCERLTDKAATIVIADADNNPVSDNLTLPSLDPPPSPPSEVPGAVPENTKDFVPPHTRGDRDFDGNGPKVFARAYLESDATRTKLFLRIEMTAEETQSDYTTVSGTSPLNDSYLTYTAPKGFVIASFPAVQDTVRAFFESHNTLSTVEGKAWLAWKVGSIRATQNGLIRSWSIIGDTGHEEAGTLTAVRAVMRSFTVTLRRQ